MVVGIFQNAGAIIGKGGENIKRLRQNVCIQLASLPNVIFLVF